MLKHELSAENEFEEDPYAFLEKLQEKLESIIKDAKDLGEAGAQPQYVKGRLSVAREINHMIDGYFAMPDG